jgi:hypothetical protein
LAILVYIVGIIVLIQGLFFLGVLTIEFFQTPSWGAGNEFVLGIGWIILALIIMAVGSGLWYLKKWSWFATTIFSIIGLILSGAGLPATWLTFGAFLVLLIYLIFAIRYFR